MIMNKKIHYKIELLYVKYSPILISLGLLLNNILTYFDIYIHVIGGYLFSASVLTIGHLYTSSKLYKFCKYHRMFIHYIVVNNALNALDYYVGIPTSDLILLALHMAIAGIFLFFVLYYHQKYGGRKHE